MLYFKKACKMKIKLILYKINNNVCNTQVSIGASPLQNEYVLVGISFFSKIVVLLKRILSDCPACQEGAGIHSPSVLF
jgi:hypothetical protein